MGSRQHFRSRLAARVGFCLWVSIYGCTESHDVEPADAAAGSGDNSPQAGRSGNGGSGGRGGSGGSGNTGTTLTCGDKACPPPAFFGMPCCTADDKCGLDVSALGFGEGCLEMGAPGTPNDACPSTSLGGFPVAGCCTPEGKCGLDATLAGLGCTTVGSAEGMTCQP